MCLEGILASLEDDGTQSFPHPCTPSNGASLWSSLNVWSSLCAPGEEAHHSGQAWRNCSPVRQHVKKQEEEVWDANSPYKGSRRRSYLPPSGSFLGPNTLCTLIVNLWAFETSKLDIPVILFIYVIQYRSFIMVLYIHWMERIEYLCNESVRLRLRNKPYSSIPKNSKNIEAFKKTLK